ncbi:glycosyltransferase family 2 protein [Albibacterium profundi]|uniref:Glycosyltransferase family 2 protein n=1 Tax=Albibacterium profundi TaxID=3134906 RepID=A0ABV5CB36_9SPHI
MEVFFWISLTIVVYTFIGYGAVLFLLVKIKRAFGKKAKTNNINLADLPTCSVLIAAYNEESVIRQKIENTLALNYPSHLIQYFIVTDGSTDSTNQIVSEYPSANLLFEPQRSGKINAIHRSMSLINSDVVVFTDANTFLNEDALLNICRHYTNPQVGGVAGEKRIYTDEKADASSAGEGFYWKYESKLKEWDSELNTAIGAAGELFSIRRELYQAVPSDTILDDFMISMQIAMQGHKIVYEPEAYALETSSSNVREELKRKIRIATGGIQSIINLKALLNPVAYGILSFQYISHRVLRWSITPILLIITFILNGLLVIKAEGLIYSLMFGSQLAFYLLALLGYRLEKKELKLKIAFIPYYFCVMNYAVIVGTFKYFTTKRSAVWEKAERKENIKYDGKFVS